MIYSLEHLEMYLTTTEEKEKFTLLIKKFRLYDKIDLLVELSKNQK